MPKPIQHLIFDLGGLFIDVHMHRFAESLQQMVGQEVSTTLQHLQAEGLFNAYEVGTIGSTDFIDALRLAFDPAIAHAHYAHCWNAILGKVQVEPLALIQPLREKYDVVLLSNTNELHVKALEADFEQRHPGKKLQHYFDRVYYSQEIGMRKPDEEVFAFVTHDGAFDPEATLFMDDSEGHLQGARRLGIQTHLHPQNAPLLPSLQSVGLL